MGLTKRQQEIRRTGIGASEVAALAGLSDWAAPIDIWRNKVEPAPRDATLRQDLGNLLEEPIARIYARETGKFLLRCDTLRHRSRPFAIATPDRLVYPGRVRRADVMPQEAERLLQVKTADPFHRKEWGAPGTSNIPGAYFVQVHWEMDVAGVELEDLAVLFGREEYAVYHFVRDGELLEGLHEIVERFWVDHVLTKRPPPPDASSSYAEFLGSRHPRHTPGKLVTATEEIENWARRLRMAEDEVKRNQELADMAKNQIRAFIGDAEELRGGFFRMLYRQTAPGKKVDWEGVARQLAQAELVRRLEAAEEAAKAPARAAAQAEFSELVESFTKERQGGRRLLKQWAGEVSPAE